jgi:hypothetical protein
MSKKFSKDLKTTDGQTIEVTLGYEKGDGYLGGRTRGYYVDINVVSRQNIAGGLQITNVTPSAGAAGKIEATERFNAKRLGEIFEHLNDHDVYHRVLAAVLKKNGLTLETVPHGWSHADTSTEAA